MAQPRDLPHLLLSEAGTAKPYRSPRTFRAPPVFNPPSDRPRHGAALSRSILQAAREAEQRRALAPLVVDPRRSGIFVTVEGSPRNALDLAGLEAPGRGVEVVACVLDDGIERATVYLPDTQRDFFLNRLQVYASSTGAAGATGYRDIFDRVAAIRLAALRALWTDDPSTFPEASEDLWWEVWLRRSDGRELRRFRDFAAAAGVDVGPRRLDFDDRIVVVARSTAERLASIVDVLGDLGELRRARESPQVFDEMSRQEKRAWIDDAARGVRPPPSDAPGVCVLDTGVHQPHPLLSPALAASDCHVVDPSWSNTDTHGHGTSMAGLALHGDLVETLLASGVGALRHRLESVKILDLPRQNRPELYGSITVDAVSLVEIDPSCAGSR